MAFHSCLWDCLHSPAGFLLAFATQFTVQCQKKIAPLTSCKGSFGKCGKQIWKRKKVVEQMQVESSLYNVNAKICEKKKTYFRTANEDPSWACSSGRVREQRVYFVTSYRRHRAIWTFIICHWKKKNSDSFCNETSLSGSGVQQSL